MRIPRTRKAILTGAAAVGVVLGAAGITAAATNSSSPSTAEAADQAESPSYTSSITAPENATLDGLAKITPAEAAAKAGAATNGTAGKVELENENGNVVYGVEITQADGTKLDVKVDAGNGEVLAKESDGDSTVSDAKDAETNDAAEQPASTK